MAKQSKPKSQPKPKAVDDVVTPVEEAVEDRSMYNCEPCKGEGLVGDPAGAHTVCTACGGTGKV